jgi:hypothetical protein
MQAKSKTRRTVSNCTSLFQGYTKDTERYLRTVRIYMQMRSACNGTNRGSKCREGISVQAYVCPFSGLKKSVSNNKFSYSEVKP